MTIVTFSHRTAPDRASRGIPNGPVREQPFSGQIRAKLVTKNGQQYYQLDGFATVFDKPYQMYDSFGPYMEDVAPTALDESLAASPDTAFLVNHSGLTMARTTNGSLTLAKDSTGLHAVALVNASRHDVQDLASAVADGLVTEMSFAFELQAGQWNDDFSQFTITRADINRGDVSAVNYGANPYTSISAGSGASPAAADDLILGQLAAQDGQGRSLAAWRTLLDADQLTATPGLGYEGTLGRWRQVESEASEDYAALSSQIRARRRGPTDAEGYRLEELRLAAEYAASMQSRILTFADDLRAA